MTAPCCSTHTTTCGQIDTCCDRCPSLRESFGTSLAGLLGLVGLLVAWTVALA